MVLEKLSTYKTELSKEKGTISELWKGVFQFVKGGIYQRDKRSDRVQQEQFCADLKG